MPLCPTSSATQSTSSGFVLKAVRSTEQVPPEWFHYQQEVGTCRNASFIQFIVVCNTTSPPAPPTPNNVTAWLMNASSVRVAWQWTRSGPAPSCFNTTTVTYHPEEGGESSLQLSDPAATEATLTDLQCNTNYTVTVVATAGRHRSKKVTMTVYLPLQGIPQHAVHLCNLYTLQVLNFE